MSEPEKPLHVRVAEALGWWDFEQDKGCILLPGAEPHWRGRQPDKPALIGERWLVPRYDTDWSATGPLIEQYEITVGVAAYNLKWAATTKHLGSEEWNHPHADFYDTPLLAVCDLILALKEAGKLKGV